jgi:hypothetical protein
MPALLLTLARDAKPTLALCRRPDQKIHAREPLFPMHDDSSMTLLMATDRFVGSRDGDQRLEPCSKNGAELRHGGKKALQAIGLVVD